MNKISVAERKIMDYGGFSKVCEDADVSVINLVSLTRLEIVPESLTVGEMDRLYRVCDIAMDDFSTPVPEPIMPVTRMIIDFQTGFDSNALSIIYDTVSDLAESMGIEILHDILRKEDVTASYVEYMTKK